MITFTKKEVKGHREKERGRKDGERREGGGKRMGKEGGREKEEGGKEGRWKREIYYHSIQGVRVDGTLTLVQLVISRSKSIAIVLERSHL